MGAGISGLVAAYELMRLGLKPVVYESGHLGGRLRSQLESIPGLGPVRRKALLRQLLAESVVLAVAGTIAGIVAIANR